MPQGHIYYFYIVSFFIFYSPFYSFENIGGFSAASSQNFYAYNICIGSKGFEFAFRCSSASCRISCNMGTVTSVIIGLSPSVYRIVPSDYTITGCYKITVGIYTCIYYGYAHTFSCVFLEYGIHFIVYRATFFAYGRNGLIKKLFLSIVQCFFQIRLRDPSLHFIFIYNITGFFQFFFLLLVEFGRITGDYFQFLLCLYILFFKIPFRKTHTVHPGHSRTHSTFLRNNEVISFIGRT